MAVLVIGHNTGDDYTGSQDAYIKQNRATNNYNNTTINAETWAIADVTRGILDFDIPSVLVGAVITGAEIQLFANSVSGTGVSVDINPLLKSFVEGQVTWDQKSTGVNWTGAGCTDASDADITNLLGRTATPTASASYIFTSANLIDLIQALNGSGQARFLLRQTVESFVLEKYVYSFFASKTGTDGNRPRLRITYTVAGGDTLMPQIMM